MRIIIQPNKEELGKWAALQVVKRIKDYHPTKEKPFVLGLPTGSTPLLMYSELIKLYNEGIISFENVVTFNMDEYVGLTPNHPQSYHYFMQENLFKHVNIPEENINILNGEAKDLKKEAQRFEDKIKSYGKINLFIGGVGEDGHIAFNEPGSSLSSRTRDKELTEKTRLDNSRFFKDIDEVPKLALTIGVGTIIDSEQVMILANGSNKSEAIYHAIEGSVNHLWTISALQLHPSAIFVLDDDASEDLTVKTYKYFKEIEEDNLDVNNFKNKIIN